MPVFRINNLKDNLYRLRKDILALKPDMIISITDGWVSMALGLTPPIFEKHIPVFKPRPVQLLAAMRVPAQDDDFQKAPCGQSAIPGAPLAKLLQTKYADAYRELILLCKTNHIQLAIANHSLAVNNQSDRGLSNSYREAFPGVMRLSK